MERLSTLVSAGSGIGDDLTSMADQLASVKARCVTSVRSCASMVRSRHINDNPAQSICATVFPVVIIFTADSFQLPVNVMFYTDLRGLRAGGDRVFLGNTLDNQVCLLAGCFASDSIAWCSIWFPSSRVILSAASLPPFLLLPRSLPQCLNVGVVHCLHIGILIQFPSTQRRSV